jgi:purine-nucleoside phosphorylase
MKELRRMMTEAAEAINKKSNGFKPDIGLILGSGLGDLANELEEAIEIPYTEIPNMKISTVKGHAGSLYLGKLSGKNVMVFKGRIHYYEGYTMKDITFPVRIMQAMGVKAMIVTNASGGLRADLRPGDLLIMDDHINLMGDNPLIGYNDPDLGPRFPDMSNPYNRDLRVVVSKACEAAGIEPKFGCYCAVTGPNYETFAEVNYIRNIGADVVGMSTVPEVLVSAHAGIKTIGISCVTDVIHAPGVEVTHDEVLKVADEAGPKLAKLVRETVRQLQF